MQPGRIIEILGKKKESVVSFTISSDRDQKENSEEKYDSEHTAK